jgi:hypothetical protein
LIDQTINRDAGTCNRGVAAARRAVLDWNTPAIGFYEKLGAIARSDWTVYRLTDEALERLAAAGPAVGVTG